MIEDVIGVEALIDALIEREGGYVHHPADKGRATCFGITEAVARAHGYVGDMRHLPREEAATIYRRLYWLRPRYDEIARRAPRVVAELFDTGANMGPAVATTFLQRALTALNRGGQDYPDLKPDGRVGPETLAALDTFLETRCRASATCAWPSAGRPMRRSSTAGWPTGSVSETSRVIANIRADSRTFEKSRRPSWHFSKRSSPRCRSCSTRSFPTPRRGTGPSSNC